MDNSELRDMYANLLANSMNSVVKDGVHPSFVEIIRQLSPDEAKILKYLYVGNLMPTLGIRVVFKSGSHTKILNAFSNVPELSGCENTLNSERYINNFVRLGLINHIDDEWYTDDSIYEPLKEHNYIVSCYDFYNAKYKNDEEFKELAYRKGLCELSAFGKSFCDICLSK